jgi:hypothetical protein
MQKVEFTQQSEQIINNSIQGGIITFLCLSFFPLMYFVGKTIVALF